MTNNKIQAYAERIERLMNEREVLSADIKDLYEEVKAAQFDPRALRAVIAERRKPTDASLEAVKEAYRLALGVRLVRDDGLSLREAEKRTGASKSSIHRALSVPEVSQPDPDAEAERLGLTGVVRDLAARHGGKA